MRPAAAITRLLALPVALPHTMNLLPLFVNALVIGVIAAELIATAMGVISADQLLIVSTVSGALTLFSFRLSQQALEQLNRTAETPTELAEAQDATAGR